MWHKKHLIEGQTLRLREEIQGRIFSPYSYLISYNVEITCLKTKTVDEKTVSFDKRKVPQPPRIDGCDVVSGTPEAISASVSQERIVSFYKRKTPPPLKTKCSMDINDISPETISTATEQIQEPFRRFSLKL